MQRRILSFAYTKLYDKLFYSFTKVLTQLTKDEVPNIREKFLKKLEALIDSRLRLMVAGEYLKQDSGFSNFFNSLEIKDSDLVFKSLQESFSILVSKIMEQYLYSLPRNGFNEKDLEEMLKLSFVEAFKSFL